MYNRGKAPLDAGEKAILLTEIAAMDELTGLLERYFALSEHLDNLRLRFRTAIETRTERQGRIAAWAENFDAALMACHAAEAKDCIEAGNLERAKETLEESLSYFRYEVDPNLPPIKAKDDDGKQAVQ